jgi:hypothetical protein
MNSITTQPTPESDVRQALNYSQEQIGFLDKAVEELHNRLQEVLKSVPVQTGDATQPKPSGNWGGCRISCTIYEGAHRVEGIRNRISQIIDDLGV